jgi:hypothetical protein
MADARRDDALHTSTSAMGRRALARGLAVLFGGLGAQLAVNTSEAGKRRRRRKKRCLKKPNRVFCGGVCVTGACCPDTPCGPNCYCRRAIEGDAFCAANAIVSCEAGLCADSGQCLAGERLRRGGAEPWA